MLLYFINSSGDRYYFVFDNLNILKILLYAHWTEETFLPRLFRKFLKKCFIIDVDHKKMTLWTLSQQPLVQRVNIMLKNYFSPGGLWRQRLLWFLRCKLLTSSVFIQQCLENMILLKFMFFTLFTDISLALLVQLINMTFIL